MSFNTYKINNYADSIKALPDRPSDMGITASQLKAFFDSRSDKELKAAVNGIINELTAAEAASQIGAISPATAAASDVQTVLAVLKGLIDACITRAAADAALALKADSADTDRHFKAVSYDTASGAFEFIRENGEKVQVDTDIEQAVVNFYYEAATQSLVLTQADGSERAIPLSHFISEQEFSDSASIDFAVSNGVVTASVKAGSITDAMLTSELRSSLLKQVSDAAAAANSAAAAANEAAVSRAASAESAASAAQSAGETAIYAATSADEAAAAAHAAGSAALSATAADNAAILASSWAKGGTGSREGEDSDNARYWSECAKAAADGAVMSFNGRKGAVMPAPGDYTAADVGAAAASHSHALSELGAAAAGHSHSEYAATDHAHSEYAAESHSHSGYAAASHTHSEFAAGGHHHVINDVDHLQTALSGLQNTLDTKAAANHTHTAADVGAAEASHTHALSELGAAAAGHSHSEYAATDHTHSEYAAASHSHSGYAAASHSHTASDIGAAAAGHTHSEYAATDHTHSGYAAASHTHSGYAAAGHSHSAAEIGALSTAGGTLTGNLAGQYLTGTWLQSTADNHLGSAASKIAVQDVSGWLYHRTAEELRSDIGAQAAIGGAATTITGSNLTKSRALISNSSGKVAVSAVTSTELGYLDGATSNIQTQLNAKAAATHTHAIADISGLQEAIESASGGGYECVQLAKGIIPAGSNSSGQLTVPDISAYKYLLAVTWYGTAESNFKQGPLFVPMGWFRSAKFISGYFGQYSGARVSLYYTSDTEIRVDGEANSSFEVYGVNM